MIQEVPEFPLVVSDKIQEYNKTKQAVIFLSFLNKYDVIAEYKNRAYNSKTCLNSLMEIGQRI